MVYPIPFTLSYKKILPINRDKVMLNNTTTKNYKSDFIVRKQRSYHEIIELLDSSWRLNLNDSNFSNLKKIDLALDHPSKKIPCILITGSNGKSLTAHFASKLFMEEKLLVGTLTSPHILTYNERIAINNEPISNKTFTDIANKVLHISDTLHIDLNSYELLTIIALVYFDQQKVSLALLETSPINIPNAPAICTPKIVAISRIVNEEMPDDSTFNKNLINNFITIIKPGTYVVSADQSKINLQIMETCVAQLGGIWTMPLRKLAPLPYPFEQLHGRCAALAERICSIFLHNDTVENDTTLIAQGILSKTKGQRGRPTLEAKRQSEMHPKKTMVQFWKEQINTLPGKFQLLEKEKPSILLDTASNLDAFKNLLLGIRLLHYKKPLEGLTVIIGSNNTKLPLEQFLRDLRYFFKKTSGQIIICAPHEPLEKNGTAWPIEKIANSLKDLKLKVKSTKNFKDAFELAQKGVNERHGLVVITGSTEIINEYWLYKGVKKF